MLYGKPSYLFTTSVRTLVLGINIEVGQFYEKNVFEGGNTVEKISGHGFSDGCLFRDEFKQQLVVSKIILLRRNIW